jgi:hypothetical protein
MFIRSPTHEFQSLSTIKTLGINHGILEQIKLSISLAKVSWAVLVSVQNSTKSDHQSWHTVNDSYRCVICHKKSPV